MEEIIIKEYDSEEREGCIELLRRTFPKTSDEATFKWRFEKGNGKKPLLILAKHNASVISFNSWIPWEFKYRHDKFTGYQSGESATDMNYRSRGIFSKILRYADEIASEWKVDFFFGYPSRMSYSPFFKAGYYPIGVNYFYLRPINPLRKRVQRSFELDSNYAFDSMLEENDKITPVFDYDYCRWRYLENTKHFEIIEYSENNGSAIFFLRKKKWKGLNELILLDCQLNNFNDKFIRNSISFLDKVFSRKAAYMRTFFNGSTDRGMALRNHFPIRIKPKFCIFIVKPLSGRIDRNTLLNCNCWDTMPHCVDEL